MESYTIDDERITELSERHEVSPRFQAYIRQLAEYKIVVICDDSGSMNEMTDYNETRWQELSRLVLKIFDVLEFIRKGSIDVHFLNRGEISGISSRKQIEDYFYDAPKGGTPLLPVLERIFRSPLPTGYKGRITLVATDGEPNDSMGYSTKDQVKNLLINRRNNNEFVTFLACTDDDDSIDYLNQWDKEIKYFDVVDDYLNERKQIREVQGASFQFGYGDYIVKALLGSLVPELDQLDEVPLYGNQFASSKPPLSLDRNYPYRNYSDDDDKNHRDCKCSII
jgi:hypothetical protein